MDERKNYIEEIKKAFPGEVLKEELSSTNEVYLTIKKESLPRIANFIHEVRWNTPLLSMFGADERHIDGSYKIYSVFQIPNRPVFIVLKIILNENDLRFPSITPLMYAGHLYEREMKDMFGFEPQGNPDTRRLVLHENFPEGIFPLRKDFDYHTKLDRSAGEYTFHTIEGEGIFQVPVGPVHAGVIEPGHFRFSVAGEPIINLEIRLHYKHRGVEKFMETVDFSRGYEVAERVSGDSAVGHAMAYCQALEKIAGIHIPLYASYTRGVAAELERIANHLGDVGGIATDVAFSFPAAHLTILRERIMQLNDELSGSRFFFGLVRPGGVSKDILSKKERILDTIRQVRTGFREIVDILLSSASFMDRVKTTGRVSTKTALDLGMTGVAARASGVNQDMRRDVPYEAYQGVKFKVPVYSDGDVLARLMVRIDEVFESIKIIEQVLDKVPQEIVLKTDIASVEPNRYSIGCVEGWRGSIVYWIMTAPNNRLSRCKIRDASFCNWPALTYAVHGNIVPDFPLCNKSFNLSYAGNDL